MSRPVLRLAMPALLAIPLVIAWAGGWATITTESVPDYMVAGQTRNLTFAVRQHGVTPLSGLHPRIELRSGTTEREVRAVRTNRDGYYTAAINLPEPGEWRITIRSGFGRSNLALMPVTAVPNGARPVSYTHEQRGQRLFVAKGCVTCHTHSATGAAMYNVGPELTDRRFAPDYLEKFLANPAIKPVGPDGRRMPNLQLKPAEIASLIAFINDTRSDSEVAAKR